MRSEDINSLESEAGVIATLIHHPDWCFYSEQLLPNHFSDYVNRGVYTAIQELAKRGISNVDEYNILEVLNSSEATRGYAQEIQISKLQELIEMSDVITRHSAEEYQLLVKNILDSAFRRDAYGALKKCQELCRDMSVSDIEAEIYSKIDEVMTSYTYTDEIVEFKDMVDALWEDVKAHQNGNVCGIPFKFPTLNEYVTLEPGELCVVAAPQKGAKSMFCLNQAVYALKQDCSVMYIDSELSSRLFLCRLISHLTGIEFARVKNGRYNEDEGRTIQEAIHWIKQQRFVHIYMPLFNQQEIYMAVKRVMHKFGGLDLLVVDYLKATGNGNAYDIYNELGGLSDFIKNDLAGKLGISALAAAQLTATGKLADSAKIARNASTILLLLDKTEEEILNDGEECGNKKVIVQFNRNGMQHAQGEYLDLAFNGNIISLKEAKQHIPDSPF